MAVTGFLLSAGPETPLSGTWNTPTNIRVADNAVAVGQFGSAGTIEMDTNNFGFSTAVIPSNKYITKVELQVHCAGNSNSKTMNMQMVVSGALVGAARDCTALGVTISAAPVQTFDITADRSWSPEDFRDGTMKVRLRVSTTLGTGAIANFDYVAVQVTHDFLNSGLNMPMLGM